MFVRTIPANAPEREKVDTDQLCPPHAFDQGWGLAHGEDLHADTVPVLYCGACGDNRLMRVPADAG